jgi:hypothetical protein
MPIRTVFSQTIIEFYGKDCQDDIALNNIIDGQMGTNQFEILQIYVIIVERIIAIF